MTRIPAYSAKEIIKVLEKRGFILDRRRGVTVFIGCQMGPRRVIVPLHNRDLPKGTFYSILKQAGIDKKDL